MTSLVEIKMDKFKKRVSLVDGGGASFVRALSEMLRIRRGGKTARFLAL
jgi:hypothetical protein